MKQTTSTKTAKIEPQRIETGKPLVIAGISEHYTHDAAEKIPDQWQRFAPSIGQIPGQISRTAYGVCTVTPDNSGFDYLSGVEIAPATTLDQNISVVRLPQQQYAVFLHTDNVASIRDTFALIWGSWVPQSAHRVADGPFFERYGASFDARTGNGGVEICIPLKP